MRERERERERENDVSNGRDQRRMHWRQEGEGNGHFVVQPVDVGRRGPHELDKRTLDAARLQAAALRAAVDLLRKTETFDIKLFVGSQKLAVTESETHAVNSRGRRGRGTRRGLRSTQSCTG